MFEFFKKKPSASKPEEKKLSASLEKLGVSQTEKTSAPSDTNTNVSDSSGTITVPHFLSSENGKYRYYIEHKGYVQLFFTRPQEFINIITSKDGWYALAQKTAEKGYIKNPYQPGEIRVTYVNVNADHKMLIVELPEPKYVPLCHRIYIAFSNDFKDLAYYTIEISNQGETYFCEWTAEGKHGNFGSIPTISPSDVARGLMKVMELTMVQETYAKNFGLTIEDNPENLGK